MTWEHVIIQGLSLGMSDDEVKAKAKECINGEYYTEICKKCGSYVTEVDGNTNKAIIKTECRECFEDKKSECIITRTNVCPHDKTNREKI